MSLDEQRQITTGQEFGYPDVDSASIATTSSADRRKSSSSVKYNKEPFPNERAFYNPSYLWSPSESDLERSWKVQRSNMNGDMGNGLRKTKSECEISIQRSTMDTSFIDKKYGALPTDTISNKAARYFKSCCECSFSCILSFITSIFPVLSWLPKYKLEYVLPDIISGFTISILHIPQGMAYGILASVKAQNGLYVSFFPVLIYFLLGTSRHISIGTFAVMSLMLSSAVYSIEGVANRDFNSTNQNSTIAALSDVKNEMFPPTHLEILTSIGILVGFLQIFMGIFQLGSLTVVLSDQLVSGFSTGAACHVAVSQLKDLFGIQIGVYSGTLKLVYMLRDVFQNIMLINVATLIVSSIAIFILAVFKEQIDVRLRNKLKMPIPIDLIVVVLATTVSYLANLHSSYNVSIMKDIPTGLPEPTPPRMDLIPLVAGDSFAIAVVAFAISLSMAKLFAKKHKYVIRPNQELFALGCANVFSSFFSCYPSSASLARSLVQERTGGKTQMASVVSCGIILIVLLVLAPLFYTLPKCILSCVILVALKGMFLQFKDFTSAWGVSKLDALIWLVTFLSTVFLDVTYGLLVGIIFSILSVIFRTAMPSKTFLGQIPDTDIYLDTKRYDMVQEVKGIKIYHFESALYFINKEIFKTYLNKHVPLKSKDEDSVNKDINIHRIIVDCSTLVFVDMSGMETLLEIMKEYQEVGITVFLAGCSVAMRGIMERTKFFEKVPQHPSIFPTLQDAVTYQFLPHSSISTS